jgi:SAM-dependent methyltransferase
MAQTPDENPVKASSDTDCHDGVMDFDHFEEHSPIKKWVRRFLFINPVVRQFKGYVLDIGCGPGVYLENYSGPSLGIDAHPSNVKICTKKGIKAIEADANKFLQVNTFDTVLLSHILEHLDDPAKVIENAYRSTKYGGEIIVIVPCKEGFVSGLNDEVGHKHFIDEEFVDEKIRSLGGKKIYSSTFPPFLGGIYQELRMVFVK